MTIRITSLGSGSKGNATLIQAESTYILIDSGFSCKELESRIRARGVEPDQISALVVTHEHSDHFKGVAPFVNKYQCECWMSKGTSFHRLAENIRKINYCVASKIFEIGNLKILPLAVPHDAREALQFIIQYKQVRVGILTDLGHITAHLVSEFSDLNALLIEFNHDTTMLNNSRYPAKLKARVGGSLGHLSNEQAKQFLHTINCNQIKLLTAMHLSEENNKREIVEQALDSLELNENARVVIASQENGFNWVSL